MTLTPARLIGSGEPEALTVPATDRPVQKMVPIEPGSGRPDWKLAPLVAAVIAIWAGSAAGSGAASERAASAGAMKVGQRRG